MNLIEMTEEFIKRIESSLYIARKNTDIDKVSKDDIGDIAYIYEKYSAESKSYKKGTIVEQHGKVYRCKKDHTSDYQLMPNLSTDDYWEHIGGQDNNTVGGFWSSDKTYLKGDRVIHYGKKYEALSRNSDKRPEDNPKIWKPI